MATATSTTPSPPQGLRRELGLASTTSAVIGGIIAVGIFLTPAGMAKALGSPLWLLLVWLVIGAMTLSGALCFGELAGRFPSAGGAYIYEPGHWSHQRLIEGDDYRRWRYSRDGYRRDRYDRYDRDRDGDRYDRDRDGYRRYDR